GFATSFLVLRGSDLTRLMVTLGVALIMREIANQIPGITGGADGLQGVTIGPVLGQFEFDIFGHVGYAYCLAVLFILFLLARRIVHSPFGMSLRAVKGNPLRSASLGISVNARLVAGYTLGGFYAGGLLGWGRRRLARADDLLRLARRVFAGTLRRPPPGAHHRWPRVPLRRPDRRRCLQANPGCAGHFRSAVLAILDRLAPGHAGAVRPHLRGGGCRYRVSPYLPLPLLVFRMCRDRAADRQCLRLYSQADRCGRCSGACIEQAGAFCMADDVAAEIER